MRTTVTLDDDIYGLASLYASSKEITLGAAIGELVRKGQGAAPQSDELSRSLERLPNGMLVFAARPGDRVITSEMVRAAQEDDFE